MSIHPRTDYTIPNDTFTTAKKVFGKGTPLMLLRDHLGPIFEDPLFEPLFSSKGRRAESPGNMALICVLQQLQGLSDRQAAEAARNKIDWKYILGLSLHDTGFDFTLLSDFRSRLLAGTPETLLLETIVNKAIELGFVKKSTSARTDSTHVLAAVRNLNRYELIYCSFERALEAIVHIDMGWIEEHIPREWEIYYGGDWASLRIPKSKVQKEALLTMWGEHIAEVLKAIDSAPESKSWLKTIPQVVALRRVWEDNYTQVSNKVRPLKKRAKKV